MRSSELLAIPDGTHSPRESIAIQKVLLGLCHVITQGYGARVIPLSLFARWAREISTNNRLPVIKEEDLPRYMNLVSQRIDAKRPFLETSNGQLMLKKPDIEWDDTNLTAIEKYIESQIPIKPDAMIERISKLETTLESRSKDVFELVFTSSLTGKQQIRECVQKIMNSAKERLYVMVAYFGEEISFFPEYLAAITKYENLDLRVLVRDPLDTAMSNEDLVSEIKRAMPNRDVVRVYSPRYYLGDTYRIGHLHSKMIISERFLLVGSANMTITSLKSNEESAILTNETSIIADATKHFCTIWNRFKPL